MGISRSQIDKVGERLRAAGPDHPSPGDLKQLDGYLGEHVEPLDALGRRLADEGIATTPRLKSTRSIIEKLQRQPSTRLSQIEDLGGLRHVDDMTLAEQDATAARVMRHVEGGKTFDRRARPSFGYRAVHVVGRVSGCRLEVQIRTMRQDLWAQAMEGLADYYGRQIKYGDPPFDPDTNVGGGVTRARVVDSMLGLADMLGKLEGFFEAIEDIERGAASLEDEEAIQQDQGLLLQLREEVAEADMTVQELIKRLMTEVTRRP
jgi:hypothetical protein